MERLINEFRELLGTTNVSFLRYLHSGINWENQMIGLTGPRGIGKTTLLLQHIKANLPIDETLYVMADNLFFSANSLVDLAHEFSRRGGKYLFIDEIHKYERWSRELKLIYDLHPKLKVVFTGSSVLDILKGESDLSRRAMMYHMQGLSFREYLQLFHNITMPVYTLEQILANKVEKNADFRPYAYLSDYLERGYYPFNRVENFNDKLQQIVNLTMETDIPFYAKMNVATGRKLKKLLSIISDSVPFKPNMSTIATALAASRNKIADYLVYIEQAGMIAQLRNDTGGIRGLGKVDKIYLDNTNLMYRLSTDKPNIGNVRETFFLNQLRVKHDVISSPVADFKIGDMTFEVGGKGKSQKQITDVENAYVVKDDIEYGWRNTIPLWAFGLMY
jgi:predicted AAA+ superfamily ATPase